jgi:hypothetical protein
MGTNAGSMYPPGAPSVNGTEISVDLWLRNPERVTRRMQTMTNGYFLSDEIFSPGGAAGGAVIYDEVGATDLFTTRDVQAIEPGSAFPLVDTEDVTPKVAKVTKWGGAVIITYESRDRDDRDVLARQLTKLRNTVTRKVDSVAMAALNAAPLLQLPTAGAWNGASGDIVLDLETARSMIDDSDMGYSADTIIINPTSRIAIKGNKALRDSLPRENTALNPVTARDLNGALNFQRWIVSPRCPAGKAYVLTSKIVGSQRDEVALYTRVVDQPEKERVLVMAGRRTVPVITDPKSAVVINGI